LLIEQINNGNVMPKKFVIMGVSGCGKSLIGDKLAHALGGFFEDADNFHPPANIAKMSNGTPLDDADRWPWFDILRERIVAQSKTTTCYVLACSALKQSYRDRLRGNDSPETVVFVYLEGTKELIRYRMEQRNHFMPVALLDSQFQDLQEPQDAIVVNINLTPDEIVGKILSCVE
jgi:gluconokinase